MISVLLTLLLSPLLRLFERQPAKPPQRILVVQVAKIGDAVCTTPLLRELRLAFPEANITFACAALTAPLFRVNPHVNNVLTVDPARLRGLKAKWRLAIALRDGAYDMAICCNAGATWPVVLAWAAIQQRIGILPNYSGATTRLAGRLWTRGAIHRSGRLVMETYLDMLPRLATGPNKLEKEVFSALGADTHVSGLLLQGSRHVGITVSAGNKLKELGRAKLTDIIAALLAGHPDIRVILLGTAGDTEIARSIMTHLPQLLAARMVDSTGRLEIDQLPALLSRLALFIGVDSGLTYMADALNIPLVSVAGPADMADARPLGPQATILQRNLPCAPCSHYFRAPYACRIGTRACIEEVTAAEIVAAAERLLRKEAA